MTFNVTETHSCTNNKKHQTVFNLSKEQHNAHLSIIVQQLIARKNTQLTANVSALTGTPVFENVLLTFFVPSVL